MKYKKVSTSNINDSVIAHFGDIMTGSKNVKIDRETSIRLNKVIQIVKSGVLRLLILYDGNLEKSND